MEQAQIQREIINLSRTKQPKCVYLKNNLEALFRGFKMRGQAQIDVMRAKSYAYFLPKLVIYKQIQRKMLVGSINDQSLGRNCDETSLIYPQSESSLNFLQNGILAISERLFNFLLRKVEARSNENRPILPCFRHFVNF